MSKEKVDAIEIPPSVWLIRRLEPTPIKRDEFPVFFDANYAIADRDGVVFFRKMPVSVRIPRKWRFRFRHPDALGVPLKLKIQGMKPKDVFSNRTEDGVATQVEIVEDLSEYPDYVALIPAPNRRRRVVLDLGAIVRAAKAIGVSGKKSVHAVYQQGELDASGAMVTPAQLLFPDDSFALLLPLQGDDGEKEK